MGLVGGIEVAQGQLYRLGNLPTRAGWRIRRLAPLLAARYRIRVGMPWDFARARIEKLGGEVQAIGPRGPDFDNALFF